VAPEAFRTESTLITVRQPGSVNKKHHAGIKIDDFRDFDPRSSNFRGRANCGAFDMMQVHGSIDAYRRLPTFQIPE